MSKAPSFIPQIPQFTFPNGSYAILHSPREIEVWGANLSEHYTIHLNDIDDGRIDVIYLGFPPTASNHY